MVNRGNRKALIFFGLAILAMILLTAGVSKIFFIPESFARHVTEVQSTTWLDRFKFEGNPTVYYIFFVLLLLSVLLLFLTQEGRRRLAAIILLMIGLYLLMRLMGFAFSAGNIPVSITGTAGPINKNVTEVPQFAPITPGEGFQSETPPWLVTVVGVGLALFIVSGIAGFFWLLLRRRSASSFSADISHEAQAALDAIEAGEDFPDVILRCYARMSQVILEARGLARGDAMTPREFEQMLLSFHFPKDPVQNLTHLFEEVRYGSIPQGEDRIQRAITSLNAIIAYCETEGQPDHG